MAKKQSCKVNISSVAITEIDVAELGSQLLPLAHTQNVQYKGTPASHNPNQSVKSAFCSDEPFWYVFSRFCIIAYDAINKIHSLLNGTNTILIKTIPTQ